MTNEDKIAISALVRDGRLLVGKHISPERARSLIEQGYTDGGTLEPLPKVIQPSGAAIAFMASLRA